MTLKTLTFSLLAAAALGGAVVTTQLIQPQTAVAQAQSAKAVVDQAIRDGKIGETAAGYLAIVGGNPGAKIVDAMNEINIGRKSAYTRLARQQNVQVEVIAAITGEKQIAKAERGTKIMDKSGAWVTVR